MGSPAASREAIEKADGRFRCAFGITGTALSQMESWATEALDSFVALAETGCVEFIAETGYHSLSAAVVRERYRREAMASALMFESRPWSVAMPVVV